MKQLYKKEWQHFKHDYKVPFFILMTISIVLAIILYVGLVNQPQVANEIFKQLSKQFEEAGAFEDITSGSLFTFLLKNNLRAVLITVLLGFIPFLFLSSISSIATTASVGVILAVTKINGGNAGMLFLTGIVPHGVLELPAIFLAGSIGIYLCMQTFRKLFTGKGKDVRYTQVLKQVGTSFLFVVVPMIILAAVIEAFITPILILKFGGVL